MMNPATAQAPVEGGMNTPEKENRLANLWIRDADGRWSVIPLKGRSVAVSVCPPSLRAMDFRLGDNTRAAMVHGGAFDARVWLLLAADDGEVRVAGPAPVAGFNVSQMQGEICTGLLQRRTRGDNVPMGYRRQEGTL